MKIKILVVALVSLFAINGAMAQEQGDMRIGLGIAYGTEAGVDDSGSKGGFGITPSFEYLIMDAIGVSASYDYYFKSSVGDTDFNLSSINLDGHYYFVTGDTQVYGLAGLGILKAKIEGGGFSASDSETGLNIGAGALFGLSDTMGVNAQIKYQTAYDGQLAINVGLRFML